MGILAGKNVDLISMERKMAKHKNPFTKGTAAHKIWRHGYFHGQIDTYAKINKPIPSKEELEEEMKKAIEVMAAKFNNKIM